MEVKLHPFVFNPLAKRASGCGFELLRMLSCTETVLVAEIAAAEGQTTALSALLHAAQAAWAERDALRDRQEMVLRREAERDEEELERLRGHALLDRTER